VLEHFMFWTGSYWAFTTLGGAGHDIPMGAEKLGHHRFSAEVNWRRDTGKFGGMGQILLDLGLYEGAGTLPPGPKMDEENVLGPF
jgi:hypothetical protein